MEKAWFPVDFNELIDEDTVMLSQTDARPDSRGRMVPLYEGLPAVAYEEDVYEDGTADFLIAEGVVIRHDLAEYPFYPQVKWLFRFDLERFQNRPDFREDFRRDGFVNLTEDSHGEPAVSSIKRPKVLPEPEKDKKAKKI